MKKKVVIAMSGGVDSSTAACLLLKQGYEVIGLSMKLPNTGEVTDEGCCGVKGIDDARDVANKIGIPFYALNYENEFKKEVMDYFYNEYSNGRTPNPCIVCNSLMKFGSLLQKALGLDAEFIATGHYAKIEYDKTINRYILKKGKDTNKDQSYFLYALTQEQLSRAMFPLGDYTKTEIRELAKGFGLKVHDKPGSQEICFIPDNDYRKFLKTWFKDNKFSEGHIVDENGKIVGKHDGIDNFTIGQRKGIGAHKVPHYVLAIDSKNNSIIIGPDEKLYKNTLIAKNINWVSIPQPDEPLTAKVRIRYKHTESEAVLFPVSDDELKIVFKENQRAITPGQAVVFYQDDIVLGGGVIDTVL
jgi:tRNA-specific 2-thiouridylase